MHYGGQYPPLISTFEITNKVKYRSLCPIIFRSLWDPFTMMTCMLLLMANFTPVLSRARYVHYTSRTTWLRDRKEHRKYAVRLRCRHLHRRQTIWGRNKPHELQDTCFAERSFKSGSVVWERGGILKWLFMKQIWLLRNGCKKTSICIVQSI